MSQLIKPYEISVWEDERVETTKPSETETKVDATVSGGTYTIACDSSSTSDIKIRKIINLGNLKDLVIDKDHPLTISSGTNQITGKGIFYRDRETSNKRPLRGMDRSKIITWPRDGLTITRPGTYLVNKSLSTYLYKEKSKDLHIAANIHVQLSFVLEDDSLSCIIDINCHRQSSKLFLGTISVFLTNFVFSYYKAVGAEEEISYLKERKVATIASNEMTGWNKAYNIVFHKNKNGEKSLSFNIRHKYYDPVKQELVTNPFSSLLINECKIKLLYDNQWYDFIIKEATETTTEYEWAYTAQDAFVLELSKNGYNVTFNNDLNNNQGTATELAVKTLQDTYWDTINIDIGPPTVNESVYEGITVQAIKAIKMNEGRKTDPYSDVSPGEEVTIPAGTNILVFYHYLANKDGKFVQFILKEESEEDYVIDSNNNIDAVNFRLDFEAIINDDKEIYDGTDEIIRCGNLYEGHQVYRLVYQPLTIYDSVMERTVDRYRAGNTIIHHYKDSVYTSSDVVQSYITNGTDFQVSESASISGWSRYTDDNASETYIPTIDLISNPRMAEGSVLQSLDKLKQTEGYLEVKFPYVGSSTSSKNLLFNSGFNDYAATIGKIVQGEKYLFRLRAGCYVNGKLPNTTTIDARPPQLSNTDNLRAVVAFYTEHNVQIKDSMRLVRKMNPSGIILNFNDDEYSVKNNEITGGTLSSDGKQYILNGVPQEPSTRYIYKQDNTEYIWDPYKTNTDGTTGGFILKTDTNFINYKYMIATAQRSVPPELLTDPTTRIGIFLYTIASPNNYYYLQDVQLTKLYADAEGEPVLVGNTPKAHATGTDYYYVAPKARTDKNKVDQYTDLGTLASVLGIKEEDIKPIYNTESLVFLENENAAIFRVKKLTGQLLTEQFHVLGYSLEKVLSIEANRSNCFNILQSIAETFECWVELDVLHDENGAIALDEYGIPTKQVLFRRYAGKDNFAGFKYGINVDSIERVVDSNELVTKLIVEDSQNEYVDSGIISIANALTNTSGEQYIYNFDYFLNKGLIKDRKAFEKDLRDFNERIREVNLDLKEKNREWDYLNTAVNKIKSQRNVYANMISNAGQERDRLEDRFEQLANKTYAAAQKETISSTLLGIDTMKDTIAGLYSHSATLNNYTGLLINSKAEYDQLKLQLDGRHDQSLVVTRIQDPETSQWHVRVNLDTYDVLFGFTLDGVEYKTDVNVKSFDIVSDNIFLTNLVVDDLYRLQDSEGRPVSIITAKANESQAFILEPKQPIAGVNQERDRLIEKKNEIINEFSNKYRRFILEGTWNSNEYMNDDLYYLDAMQAGRLAAFPKITYNIKVLELGGLEGYEGYSFDTGDKTYIEDIEFFGWVDKKITVDGEEKIVRTPAREEVIVSEIEWHLDNPADNSVTIQNYKSSFEDLFQRIQATVQTVQYNEKTYPKTSSIVDGNGLLNSTMLIQSLIKISGQPYPLTSDGSVQIDGDQITILDKLNQRNLVKIDSSGISISSDAGKTWTATVTGQGINIENVFSSMINTDKVVIGNKDRPSFRWDSSGLSAYKSTEDDGYDLKTFVRFDEYGLYGIKDGEDYIAQGLEDIKEKAHFGITWNGFFIKNNYTNGYVSISTDNDFQVMQTIDDIDHERIKIGALEWEFDPDDPENPTKRRVTKYGISVKNENDEEVFVTGSDGNLAITNLMRIGSIDPDTENTHILINGADASIKTSNYQDGASYGWMINKDGNAVFNNITARGAIKTAVFEYAEIQAVGGVFLFRPSSTIRSARIADNNIDLILEVEKPALFAPKQGEDYSWCKISNYTADGSEPEPDVQDILNTNGLTHVYEISNVNLSDKEVTLIKGADIINAIIKQGQTVDEVLAGFEGGALVDMGREDGTSNYGIGVNSSDNTVNLPRRAISLFKTEIDSSQDIKVSYEYQAILGTLPELRYEASDQKPAQVARLYHDYLRDTQGIYTDNMYIGDANQYIAFYTDKNSTPQKHLMINAKELWFEANAGQGDFIFLSNSDYGKSVTINNYFTTEWRQIIGTKFGVTNDGTLYAGEAHIDGYIDAKSFIARDINGNMRAKVDTDGLTVYDEYETDIANFNDNTRIGQENYGHINIDSQGIYLYRNKTRKISDFTSDGLTVYDSSGNNIANFNTTTRIGQNSSGHLNITSSGMYLYTNSDNKVAELDSHGLYLYYNDSKHRVKAKVGEGLYAYYNDENHRWRYRIDDDGFHMYNNVDSMAGNYYKAYMDSDSAVFFNSTGNSRIALNVTSGDISLLQNGIEVGSVGFNQDKTYSNLYGLSLHLNRSTSTLKPAWVGITAMNSAGGNNYKFIYLQDNATISNYTSGALNAGCDLDMNNWSIKDIGNLYGGKYFPGSQTSKYIGYNSNGSIIITSPLMVNTDTNYEGCSMAINGTLKFVEWNNVNSYSSIVGASYTDTRTYHNLYYYTYDYHSFHISYKKTDGTTFDKGVLYIYEDVVSCGVPLSVSTINKSLTIEGKLTTTGNLNTNAIDCGNIDAEGIICTGLSSSGAVTIDGNFRRNDVPEVLSQTYAACWNKTRENKYIIARPSSSSIRYKEDIKPVINNELDPHRLYDITVKQFKFKENYFAKEDTYNQNRYDVIGFIAEDIKEKYPIAAIEIDGEVENWNERYMIPPMLKLIQEQHEEIESLKQEIQEIKQLLTK